MYIWFVDKILNPPLIFRVSHFPGLIIRFGYLNASMVQLGIGYTDKTKVNKFLKNTFYPPLRFRI